MFFFNKWSTSSADIGSQRLCVKEKNATSGNSAADTTVGTTTDDGDGGKHSEKQGDGMKETTQSASESSSKKGTCLYNWMHCTCILDSRHAARMYTFNKWMALQKLYEATRGVRGGGRLKEGQVSYSK